MNVWEAIALIALVVLTAEQCGAVIVYLIRSRRSKPATDDADCPKVLVILPLRGNDPSLSECLQSLCQQDYPDYSVRIVVDDDRDPAVPVVREVLASLDFDRCELIVIPELMTNCTLKCAALWHGTAELDDDVQLVAFLDSDVIPEPDWLRRLATPFRDSSVGAASGNRWYAPTTSSWPALVRHVWNAGAVVNMFFWHVPWGGTLAVRADVLRHSNLRDLWTKAGCDDVPLWDVLRRSRLRLAFVPDLLLVDRSDCRLTAGARFIARQFLWVRLYHPMCWWTCAGFHFLVLTTQLAVATMAIIAAMQGRWPAAGVLAFSLLANLAITIQLVVALDRHAKRIASIRPDIGTLSWARRIPAYVLTQFITAWAFLRSLLVRTVEWRGVVYRIRGPWRIRVVQYEPYRDSTDVPERETQVTDDLVTGRN